jgi:hypothetical protein
MDEDRLNQINKLEDRIKVIEKELRHCHRQFEMLIHHHEHVDGMVQQHEGAIFKLENPDGIKPEEKLLKKNL